MTSKSRILHTRESARSTITRYTDTSRGTTLQPRRCSPQPKVLPRGTFGGAYPHRSHSVPLVGGKAPAWGRHDVVVHENFWKNSCGKLAHLYHRPGEDLSVPSDAAPAPPRVPLASLRCQGPGLPDYNTDAYLQHKLSQTLNKTRKAYAQVMNDAVSDCKGNKAVLGLPATRVRHFGTHASRAPSSTGSVYSAVPQGPSMMERMEAKLGTMRQGLPSRSPTPSYPWRPPELSDEDVEALAKTPLADLRNESVFADKVLKLLPGRKL